MLWIRQQSLHDRRFQLDDQRMVRASLFPFFDGEGRVEAMMLTSDEPQILLFDWKPELFTAQLLKTRRLHVNRAILHDCELGDADRVLHLWHFDPWWELDGERYSGHPAVPALRSTNLHGLDPSITGIWFDRSLSRVTRVGTGSGESMKVERFDPAHLAAATVGRRAASRPRSTSKAQWRLRPFWQEPINPSGMSR